MIYSEIQPLFLPDFFSSLACSLACSALICLVVSVGDSGFLSCLSAMWALLALDFIPLIPN
jgi:hypothetical protein